MNKSLSPCCLAAMLLAPIAWAKTCPTWPTAERFAINGAEVTDQRTGLVWARCSVGQSWSGNTCTGSPSSVTHEAALQHAQSQSGWRLPNVKELASLADKGCQIPAIDTTAFPATPVSWYWTSSPNVSDASYAWGVNFSSGYVYGGHGINRNFYMGGAVRLVRTSATSSAPVQNPGGSVVTPDAPTAPL